MLECACCGLVSYKDDEIFNAHYGALLGAWWFCPTCYEEIRLELEGEAE